MQNFNLTAKKELLGTTYNLMETLEHTLETLRGLYKTFPECREEILKAAEGIKKEIAEETASIKGIRG